MATHQRSAVDSSSTCDDSYSDLSTSESVSSAEYLELLGDEYTRRVLSAIIDEPRTGREIIDTTEISKPTVYRRLGRLEEAGLVATEQKLDLDGHHCKRFRAVIEEIDFEFGQNGIRVSLDTESRSQSSERGPAVAVADD
jgi:DNA-binding transcriptional ArsR family regulator